METFLNASLLAGWGMRFLIAPVLFGALIVALELLFRDRKSTQRCWKCGSAFCGRCQIGTGRKGLCTQCYHLFFMKDGVSAQARNDKLAQVQRASTKRSLVYRLLSIVVPGSGHISEGAPILGVVLLFVWMLAACVVFLGESLFSLPDGLFGLATSPSYAMMAVMVAAVVVANVMGRPMTRG